MAPGKFVPSGGWSSVVYFAFLVFYYTIHVSISVRVWYLYSGNDLPFFFLAVLWKTKLMYDVPHGVPDVETSMPT